MIRFIRSEFYFLKFHYLIFALLFSISVNTIYANAESIDIEIMHSIHTNRNANLDNVMKGISNSTYIVLPTIPLGLFANSIIQNDTQQIRNSIQIGSSVIISGLTSLLLKEIIQRDRPFVNAQLIENIGNENGYSMPSIHSSTAFALATSLSLQYKKWYVIIPSYLWATGVGYSRMHLGVHYLSDVLVGAVIGAGISYLTFYLEKDFFK
jgi:membrane-associated phospholipid phosphatase